MNKGDLPDGADSQRSDASVSTPASPSLGLLPSNWEMAYTEDGTPYFIE